MMIEVTFEINGKRIDPNNLQDALERAVLQSVQEFVRTRLRAIRCPEHGEAPRVICKGRSIDDLSFEVTGCCQSLIDAVIDKLK